MLLKLSFASMSLRKWIGNVIAFHNCLIQLATVTHTASPSFLPLCSANMKIQVDELEEKQNKMKQSNKVKHKETK